MSVILSREFWLIGPRFSRGVSANFRPEIESAVELRPEVTRAEDLKPDLDTVTPPEIVAVDPVPTVTSAADLKPTIDPRELKPRISAVTEED